MADDLDDEWWLENDTLKETSEPEDEPDATTEKLLDSKPLKRKCEQTTESGTTTSSSSGDDSESECTNVNETTEIPKKKKKRKRKGISVLLEGEKVLPLKPIALLGVMKKYYDGKLSIIEKEEVEIEDKHFALCNDMTHTPTSYMKTIIPKWKKIKASISSTPGSPLIIIITSAAIRATELIRQLADFRGDDCKIGKLFAKHMKVKDQKKFLDASIIHIGVGTPNRLYALLDTGCLHLDQVKYIVLDWSWRDIKYKRLIDSKEIKLDLMKLLKTYLIPHVKKTKSKFALL